MAMYRFVLLRHKTQCFSLQEAIIVKEMSSSIGTVVDRYLAKETFRSVIDHGGGIKGLLLF